jgi:hypothetical protein
MLRALLAGHAGIGARLPASAIVMMAAETNRNWQFNGNIQSMFRIFWENLGLRRSDTPIARRQDSASDGENAGKAAAVAENGQLNSFL